MRFRKFFIAHEFGFLALFMTLGGATSGFIIAAVVFSSVGCLVAALLCFAPSAVMWAYVRKLERLRLIELEESLRDSGRSP
jgi:hypothetical protein